MEKMSQHDLTKSPSFLGRSMTAANFPAPTANNSFHEYSFQDQSKANDTDYYNIFSSKQSYDVFYFKFSESYLALCINVGVALFSVVFLLFNVLYSEISKQPLFFVAAMLSALFELMSLVFNALEYIRPGRLATRIYYCLSWWVNLLLVMILLYVTTFERYARYMEYYCSYKIIELIIKITEAMTRKLVVSIGDKQ